MNFQLHPARGRTVFAVALAAALGFGLGGCATAKRVPLSAEKRTQVAPAQGIVGLSQQEIASDINQSNLTAAGGGLVFALIDAGINNSRAKKAESAAAPVRDALVSYDAGEALAAALRRELDNPAAALTTRGIEVRPLSEKSVPEAWARDTEAPAVLIVNPGYRLTPAFDGITFTATVSLHARDAKIAAGAAKRPRVPGGVIYYNVFASSVQMAGWPGGTMPPAEAAKLWAHDDGRKARETMDAGLAELARMIAYDLAAAGPADNKLYKAPEGAEARTVPLVPGVVLVPARGYVTKIVGDRAWVRLPTGELIALPR